MAQWQGATLSRISAVKRRYVVYLRDCFRAAQGVLRHLFGPSPGATGSEECLELGGSAADFWTALVTCETISEAKAALRQRYNVKPKRLESDLRAFVKSLVDRQFLETEGTADAISS